MHFLIKCFTIILLFFFLILTSYSQVDLTKVHLVPNWRIGDSFDLKITKIKTQWRADKMVKNDSSSFYANLKVLDSTALYYKLQWSNQIDIPQAPNLLELLQKKISELSTFNVVYRSTRSGEYLEIENWQEVSSKAANLFDFLIDSINADKPTQADQLRNAYKPFYDAIKTKLGVENLLLREIKYIHFPFDIEFQGLDTIYYEDEIPNLFGGDAVRGDVKLYIEKVNIDAASCNVVFKMKLNPNDAKNMLRALFEKMKLDDAKINEALPKANIEMFDHNTYSYNYDSGKPLFIEIKRTTLINLNDSQPTKSINITRLESKK